MIKETSDYDFNKDVLEEDLPVVVDFWAPWCGPCKMMSPIIDDLNKKYSHKVRFIKVNIDKNPGISQALRISSIPTIMLFDNGKVMEKLVGFKPKQTLENTIREYI